MIENADKYLKLAEIRWTTGNQQMNNEQCQLHKFKE